MGEEQKKGAGRRADPPPILSAKRHDQPSVFTPENLLREARRQKNIPAGPIPAICALDPDGDMVRYLRATGQARRNPHWACYHTDLYDFEHDGIQFGMVGCAVGASFAVLIAEEMFAAGCQLLISVTSAGQITPKADPPYFVLIEQALRDEGTSYHYLPPSDYVGINPALLDALDGAFVDFPVPVHQGAAWTTDAPFRETEASIQRARRGDILAVEMEAAALYAFAQARSKPVVCLAHVTNQMAVNEGDFEKGVDNGARLSLDVLAVVARRWLAGGDKMTG